MSALNARVGMGTASTVARSLGQATGRVDVAVDAITIATSFDYVGCRSAAQVSAVCCPRKTRALMSRKRKKTVFVKVVERKTRVGRVVDSTKMWELLDEGIDMWVAVNGKRVDRNATMAQGHNSLLWAASGEREGGGGSSTVQTSTTRHSGSVDMLTVWAGNRCGPRMFDVFGSETRKHHEPVPPGPIIGPTGRAPQRVPATNPTFRRDGRQNKISGQHVPSVVPPRQPPAENVGSSNALPWAPGVRVDLVRELLKIFFPVKTMPSIVHSWNHQKGKSLRSIKIWLTNSRSMVRF